VEFEPVGGDLAGLADEPENGAPGHGLARARFPHDPQPLAPEREGNALHHLNAAGMGGEADAQIFDIEERGHDGTPVVAGLQVNASNAVVLSQYPFRPPALPADLIRGPLGAGTAAEVDLQPAHGSRPWAAPVVLEGWDGGDRSEPVAFSQNPPH